MALTVKGSLDGKVTYTFTYDEVNLNLLSISIVNPGVKVTLSITFPVVLTRALMLGASLSYAFPTGQRPSYTVVTVIKNGMSKPTIEGIDWSICCGI